MIRLRVFYEDQAAFGAVKQFGPHILLCACVGDAIGAPLWEVKPRIGGEPKKSGGKLLAACKAHAERGSNEIIFALFDGDKLHVRLKIPKLAPEGLRSTLEQAIASPSVRPFVLDRNLETLVEAAAGCLEPPVSETIRKGHNERDRILNRAATASRSVRDCIRARVPTFAALVDAVVMALT